MKIKLTKVLEDVLARAIISTYQTNTGTLADRAVLVLLDEANCHANHIFRKFLQEWELPHIKSKIEQELTDDINDKEGAKRQYDEVVAALEKLSAECNFSGDSPMLNTGLLLLYIMSGKQCAASRVLELYGLKNDAVKALVDDLPADEDYYAEMRALQNIRIIKINTPRTTSDAGNDRDVEDNFDGDDYSADPSGDSAIALKQAKKNGSRLDSYCTDLTEAAARGKVDPVIGRDREIERLIQILGRRKKNNPILVGEAGVGKSAIVEGLALRMVKREVPASLTGKRVLSLDLTSIVAGTKYRGQFEERIRAFVDELSKSKDVILFIDEIHTIVGAGSTQGSLDMANVLKPALARGELQCIGATTLDEFRENIEKDGALERRFQKILVEPTSKEDTLAILNKIKANYEQYHAVKYSDEAIKACVELTDRYVTDRHFPDKAIDVLDEAGSKACLANGDEPEEIRRLEDALSFAKEEKRMAAKVADYEKAAKARVKEMAIGNKLKEQRADWQNSRRQAAPVITPENIQDVVSFMTGIPVQNVSHNEKTRLKEMYSHLESLVVGQPKAIEKVTKSIQRSRTGLKDPDKPIGVFMFVGPTGVGKTLLAKELSKWIFNRPDALVRIDMSEYSEKHNVSRLVGSPPGYVGYNEGGQLTEIVRRQPYSVILFDEIEKAHSDVFNIMLQIFDEGRLTDGLGRKVDFRNTVIIMTSNAGSRKAVERVPAIGFNAHDLAITDKLNDEDEYRKALEVTFAPEFINRIDDVVVFNTLSLDDVRNIVGLELRQLFLRAQAKGYTLDFSEEAKKELADLGYNPRYGVRSLKRIILDRIEEPLAEMIVNEEVVEGDEICIGVDAGRVVLFRNTPGSLTCA